MVKAKFVGSSTVNTYKTAQFNAIAGNKISMSESTWDSIVSKGDDKLFKDVVKVEKSFPAQRTVGA
jgi:hypothetical protein